MTSSPVGLLYFDSAVPPALLKEIEKWYSSSKIQEALFPVTNAQGKSTSNSRRVLHYGYSYNYRSGGTKEKVSEMPVIIRDLRDWIARDFIIAAWRDSPKDIDEKLNQCIINRYLPGQGIGAHSDSSDYGDIVACFTFLSGREMEFTRGSEKYTIYTTPGSKYAMTDESRYDWKHQMRSRKSDKIDGKIHPRSECFSVTFRMV